MARRKHDPLQSHLFTARDRSSVAVRPANSLRVAGLFAGIDDAGSREGSEASAAQNAGSGEGSEASAEQNAGSGEGSEASAKEDAGSREASKASAEGARRPQGAPAGPRHSPFSSHL